MDVETKAKDLQTLEPPKTISQRTENIILNPIDTDLALAKEEAWKFQQILGMKRHIATVEVDPSITAGSTVYSYQNSPFAVLTLFEATNLSSYFSFFRFNLVFNIEVQSAMQHVGALIVNQTNLSFISGSNNNAASALPWIGLLRNFPTSVMSRTILPHDFISLGHNGFYSITMPWNCSRRMLPTNRPDQADLLAPSSDNGDLHDYDLGALDIGIFSPMLVQSAVYSTASIRILASLENIDYSGYRPAYTI